jgi:hypothetical protein
MAHDEVDSTKSKELEDFYLTIKFNFQLNMEITPFGSKMLTWILEDCNDTKILNFNKQH